MIGKHSPKIRPIYRGMQILFVGRLSTGWVPGAEFLTVLLCRVVNILRLWYRLPFNQRPLLRQTQEKKRSKLEGIKEQSNFLREPLASELLEDTTHFTESAIQILKFHGSYQQDNRDKPGQGPGEGLSNDAAHPQSGWVHSP